jgi:hypothetical protein
VICARLGAAQARNSSHFIAAPAALNLFDFRIVIHSCVTVCAKAANPLRDSPVMHMTMITVSASYYLFSID